jgi:hypothetical protein
MNDKKRRWSPHSCDGCMSIIFIEKVESKPIHVYFTFIKSHDVTDNPFRSNIECCRVRTPYSTNAAQLFKYSFLQTLYSKVLSP